MKTSKQETYQNQKKKNRKIVLATASHEKYAKAICINHSLLTIEAMLKRGQKVFGWVANILDNNMLEVDANISSLKERIKQPLIATIPYSPDQKPENLKNYVTWPNDL